MTAAPLRIAVLVSGEGTTALALLGRLREGAAPAEIVLGIADRDCPAVRRLREADVVVAVIPKGPTPEARWGEELAAAASSRQVELALLLGFRARVPETFLARFPGRVLNVHPSLLPRHGGRGMFGSHVHEAVLAAGDATTGVTVHEVTGELDAGPIRWQRAVAVEAGETPTTLRQRVRPLELAGLIEVLEETARSSRGQ